MGFTCHSSCSAKHTFRPPIHLHLFTLCFRPSLFFQWTAIQKGKLPLRCFFCATVPPVISSSSQGSNVLLAPPPPCHTCSCSFLRSQSWKQTTTVYWVCISLLLCNTCFITQTVFLHYNANSHSMLIINPKCVSLKWPKKGIYISCVYIYIYIHRYSTLLVYNSEVNYLMWMSFWMWITMMSISVVFFAVLHSSSFISQLYLQLTLQIRILVKKHMINLCNMVYRQRFNCTTLCTHFKSFTSTTFKVKMMLTHSNNNENRNTLLIYE